MTEEVKDASVPEFGSWLPEAQGWLRQCLTCGSLVGDERRHAAWHAAGNAPLVTDEAD